MLLVGAFGHVRVGKRGDCECGMAWDGLFRLFLKKLIRVQNGENVQSAAEYLLMSEELACSSWQECNGDLKWPLDATECSLETNARMHLRKRVTAQRLKKSSPQVRLCPHVIKLVSHDWVHCTRGLHRVTPSYSYGPKSQECIQYLCTTKSRSSTEGGLNPVRVRCDHESMFIR